MRNSAFQSALQRDKKSKQTRPCCHFSNVQVDVFTTLKRCIEKREALFQKILDFRQFSAIWKSKSGSIIEKRRDI